VTDLITAPAGIVVASHLFAEAYRDPRLTRPPRRPRHTRTEVTPPAGGGPLGLVWAPDGVGRIDAPSGPYWLTIEHTGSAWRWIVTDSWTALQVAEGAAHTLRGAIVQSELAVVVRRLDIVASSVTVAAAIAFGDWPAEAVAS